MADFKIEIRNLRRWQFNAQTYLGPDNTITEDDLIPTRSEIFLKNISKNVKVDDIFWLCRKYGLIYQIRLPVSFDGNKGLAFVRYWERQDALAARKRLNNSVFKNRKIKVAMSLDNRTLQIMDWPVEMSKTNVEAIIKRQSMGLEELWFGNNFLVCTFSTHTDAQKSLRELKKLQLFGRICFTNDNDIPEEVLWKVNTLYVGNLPMGCSKQTLMNAVEQILKPQVPPLKIHNNFAFICFVDHEEATNGLLRLRAANIEIDGKPVSISYAKDKYSKKSRERAAMQKFNNLHPSQ